MCRVTRDAVTTNDTDNTPCIVATKCRGMHIDDAHTRSCDPINVQTDRILSHFPTLNMFRTIGTGLDR
eukprot:m.346784 g.346784  ORF g.346784 m.346784 type:complete len:68 (-) comp27916_c0_seq8:2826-3029(-)